MSTKTSIKRIALVAVSALGLGVLTSVAPASAAPAERTPTSITLGTPSPARAGQITSVSVGASFAAALEDNDTMTVAAKILTAPSNSLLKTASANILAYGVSGSIGSRTGYLLFDGSSTGATDVVTNSDATAAVAGIKSYAVSAIVQRNSTSTTSTSWGGLNLKFTPDVAGTYTILVSAGHTTYTAGDVSATLTITTAGAPTKITVTSVGGQVVTGGTYGQVLAVTLQDANGLDTVLAADEAISVTTTDTTLTIDNVALAPGEDVAGEYEVHVTPNGTIAAGSSVVTFTGSGLIPATVVTNTSVTKVLATTETADTVNCTTSTNCPSATGGATAGAAFAANVAGATSLTIGGLTSATAAKYHLVKVQNNSTGYNYDTYITVAATAAAGTAGAATTTFTAPAPSLLGTVVIDFGATTATMTYVKPYAAAIAVQGSASVLSATAAKNTFVVKVSDQYGNAVAYNSVSASVSGRNTVATTALGVTDANGLISYSLTDAGTTGTKDTITFTTVGGSAGATTYTDYAYVTYGTVTVDSVAVTGGSTVADAGVAGTTLTAISAADNGPEASAKAITATVKDANGNLLAGVPVTFAVSSGLVKKTSAVDYATVYTGADGTAVSYVFDWVPGTQTITATAGGKSSTDYLTWAATDATSARVLSATAAGNVVSVKVVDRFGNGVKGVSVSLSRVGTGFFGNGTSTATLTTDKSGTADIQFNGSASVVAELDTATYVQAGDVAGKIAATAVTAAVAGTTTGTGASLAPAGVNKVSVDVTDNSSDAIDAANEATDAANAATDAANAAAEAADAATAAAQDAQAAVAALATQVATMINGIKAQVIRLTNLVVKIQKKVGA